MSAAMPPIDNAYLPADVRNGTKERRQQYDAALSFDPLSAQGIYQALRSGLLADETR